VDAAIPTTEDYIAAAEDYLDVYSKYANGVGDISPMGATGSDPEALQKIAEAESKMEVAWSAMIVAAQKVTGTSSTGLGSLTDVTQASLVEDTINVTLRVVEKAATIRTDLNNPESSINKQLADLQQKGTEMQTAIQTCQQYLLQLQQQQQTTNPFRF